MRASNDPSFIADQLCMRDTTLVTSSTPSFLNSVKKLDDADVRNDFGWAFAPIGVISQSERDYLNYMQMHRFACYFGLPVVRWHVTLDYEDVLGEAQHDEIYEAEINMWQYFVRGMPLLLTEALKSVRNLVNGTPCLADDFNFGSFEPPSEPLRAYQNGIYEVITLDHQPEHIIMRAGSSKNQPDSDRYKWHGVNLDDLDGLLVDFVENFNNERDEQLIPLPVSKNSWKVHVYSAFSALHGVPGDLRVKGFGYIVAFSMTVYKVQGKSMPKLLVNLPVRQTVPHMKTADLYVLISRTFLRTGLRWFIKDHTACEDTCSKAHDAKLHA